MLGEIDIKLSRVPEKCLILRWSGGSKPPSVSSGIDLSA